MFTKEMYQLLMVKQTAWSTEPVSPTTGILIPRLPAGNVETSRNKIENPAVFADGFEREFALGNRLSNGNVPIVGNLNVIGHFLKALCGQDVVTSGVYTVTVTAGGTGYSNGAVGTFTGGTLASGGTAATATAVVVGGVITAVTVTSNGSYSVVPTGVTFPVGTGATFTIQSCNVHTMLLSPTTVPYYLFEDGIPAGTSFYRHLDHVINKLALECGVEGLMQPSFNSVGSGILNPASANNAPYTTSIQPSAAEVIGTPVEYANITNLENAVDPGTILSIKYDIDRKVVQKRPTGANGAATDAKWGMSKIGITFREYFETDARWLKARAGTITSVASKIVSGNDSLIITGSEVKFEPTDYKAESDEGIIQEFKATSFKKSSANSPIMFVLNNTVATYP
jgi:hypothetical protein